jgi:hypothetical protein
VDDIWDDTWRDFYKAYCIRYARTICILTTPTSFLHAMPLYLLSRDAPTPRAIFCRRPRPRLAHVPALWRDHRRHRHALLGSAVAMGRREGLALRPRPAGLLALAGKPVWNARAVSQSISAHRPRLAEAGGRPRESSIWRWRRVCWRAHWPRPLGAAALDSGAGHIWMATRRPCVSGSISCMFSTPERIVR